MNPDVDLSPETICGTVIDTQETLIRGEKPNAHQIRACKLANASEELHEVLTGVMMAAHEHFLAQLDTPAAQAAELRVIEQLKLAARILKELPPPRRGGWNIHGIQ
jgi:hypothetical protein